MKNVGIAFAAVAAISIGSGLFLDPETVVRMRILAVIDYLNRIQEK